MKTGLRPLRTVLLASALISPGAGIAAQAVCAVSADGPRLVGGCDHPWFSGLELDFGGAVPSTVGELIARLPTDGVLVLRETVRFDTQYVVTHRAGFPQVLLKPENPGVGWFTFDDLTADGDTLRFVIDPDPTVPASAEDVEIVGTALALLSDASRWHQQDDRECDDDRANDRWSLFCALQEASIRTTGEYNHRGAALQALRHAIERRHPGRRWEHRLRDYNNLDDTTYEEVRNLLIGMRTELERELASAAR